MFNYRVILEKYSDLREEDAERVREGIKTLEEYRLWLKFKDGIDDTWLILR